jgi:P27 family predicted phage terminase small subunit
MKRGPRKTPKALNELHGNPSKHALPEAVPDGVGALWEPPSWFDDDQRAQWQYTLDHAPAGVLSGTDRELLVVWVAAAVEHAKAVRQVRAIGQTIKGERGTMINPALRIMDRQAHLMLRTADALGFSPAARTSLGREAAPGEARYTPSAPSSDRLDAYLLAKPDRLQ